MSTAEPPVAKPSLALKVPTLADLLESLGVAADRVMARPAPGTATLDDVISARSELRLCELVDGVLVEKAIGILESFYGAVLTQFLWNFVEPNDLGIVLGADGMIQIAPNLVRMPDVAFFSWTRLPDGQFPLGAAPPIAPDLAVEILSPSNTTAEMDRKLREYFAAGTHLVWYANPIDRTVRVYTAVDQVHRLDESGTLHGGEVLPGFELPLRVWFDRAERKKP